MIIVSSNVSTTLDLVSVPIVCYGDKGWRGWAMREHLNWSLTLIPPHTLCFCKLTQDKKSWSHGPCNFRSPCTYFPFFCTLFLLSRICCFMLWLFGLLQSCVSSTPVIWERIILAKSALLLYFSYLILIIYTHCSYLLMFEFIVAINLVSFIFAFSALNSVPNIK